MSDTGSDEVMLRHNPRFRGNGNGNGENTRPAPGPRQILEQNIPGRRQRGRTNSKTNLPNHGDLGLGLGLQCGGEAAPTRPSVDADADGPSQIKSPASGKKDPYKAAPPSTLEELKKLQQEIVVKAHLNRFKDLDPPSTNPEALVKVREGPGTDPKSEIYRELAKHRAVPGKSSSAGAQNRCTSSKDSQTKTWLERYQAQWTAYAESPSVYPVIEDGRLLLLSEPTPGPALVKTSGNQELGLRMDIEGLDQPETAEQAAEHNWGDSFYADWEFRPRACSSFEAFRDWFRRWLESTIPICCYVDIYHPAFFDGTAHPDGEKSLLIPEFDDDTTRLDWNDEESRLHHETVEGYCYNWGLKIKKEEEEEQERRLRARNAYIEGTKSPLVVSPQVPKANLYLRPVELGDIPELLEIFNWYIQKSTLTLDVVSLDAEEVRGRIESSKRERLPFIVAAERRSAHSRDRTSQRLLGYALATDPVGDRTAARFTAQLEIFVRPEYKRRGVGRCLMDKLLEVCDPTHISLGGYFFDASRDERPGYWSGGRRRLARLVFVIGYPPDDRQQYKWIHEWLENEYGFEQQGMLKGTRIKFTRFLNVNYLVRRVGLADDDTMRN